MNERNVYWWVGQSIAVIVGAVAWSEHGMAAGLITVYVIGILVDIRKEVTK